MALIVTLALLVLVTIAAMAFFARATANRTIEASRANQVLAAQLAQSAEDYVLSRFLQEMGSNAIAYTANGTTVYQVTNAAGMVPVRSLAQSSMATDTNFANLIRQSISGADTNASGHSTAAPSQNGRFISTDRWNAPRLNFGNGFNATNQIPNWIYITRNGTVTNSPSTNVIGRFAYNVYETGGLLDANVAGYPASVSGNNLQAIKGTLAGANLTALGVSQAAIDDLVGFRNPQATNSAAAYTNYVAGAAKTGFLNTVVTNGSGSGTTTNNFFASRQDLIRYATTKNTALTNALPYLTHASRSSTAPSWGPNTPTGSNIDYAALSNNSTAANRFLPNYRVTNSNGAERIDGTIAKPGEPFLNKRFPLSWLRWLEEYNPTTRTFPAGSQSQADMQRLHALRQANAAAAGISNIRDLSNADNLIRAVFGLRWNNTSPSTGGWDYVGTGTTPLKNIVADWNSVTLTAAGGRSPEPNFFQRLKVGILEGSLGQGSYDGGFGNVGSPLYSRIKDLGGDYLNYRNLARTDKLADYHVFQLGSNIIDQADADSFPTRITFDAATASNPFQTSASSTFTAERGLTEAVASVQGQEAIPYISKIIPASYRPREGTSMGTLPESQPTYRPWTRHWMRFELWNPCESASATSLPKIRVKFINPSQNTGRPLRMRLSDFDNNRFWISSPGAGSTENLSPTLELLTTASGTFGNPKLITPADVDLSGSTPQGVLSESEAPFGSFAGIWLGDMNAPDVRISGTPLPTDSNMDGVLDGSESLNAAMGNGVAGESNTTTLNAALAAASSPLAVSWGGRMNHGPVITTGWPGNMNNSYADFDLQVQVNGQWRTYQTVRNFEHGSQTHWYWFVGDLTNPSINETQTVMHAFMSPDPRTQRFDIHRWNDDMIVGGQSFSSSRRTQSDYNTILFGQFPSTTRGRLLRNSTTSNTFPRFFNDGTTEAPQAGAGGWPTADNNRPVVEYAENTANSTVSYTDVDGIRRPGDSLSTSNRPFGNSSAHKPVILNRPFRSVGELSYTYRDLPWKSIDFLSATSADGALLDLFSVEEEPSQVAGKLNPNRTLSAILANLIEGNLRIQGNASSAFSATEATQIAQALGSYLANPNNSFRSAGDLVNGFMATLPTSGSTTLYPLVKHQRESIVRALAPFINTRNWLVFVDALVQSGRFPTASVSAGNFIVESEARTWGLWALDRFTGNITMLSKESISE